MKFEQEARGLFRDLQREMNDIIVTLTRNNVQHVKFYNNKISVVKNLESYYLGIFGAIGKKIVFSDIKNLNAGKMNIIKSLTNFAKSSADNHDYHGIAKGPFKYLQVPELYDKRIVNLGNRTLDIAEKGINSALANGAKRVSGVFESGENEILLLTSGKVDVKEKGTYLYFSIRAFSDKDASGHCVEVSRVMNKFNAEKTAEKAANIAVMAKNPTNGPVGKFEILFDPLPFANLLDLVGNSASIFNTEAGLSFFQNCLNKKVASDIVNINDNGLLKNGLGSGKCDAEGFPSQNTIIIQKGVFKNYLHNTSTAKKYNARSSGNAGIIAPEPRNIVLKHCKDKFEKLLQSIKKGIYVTNVWYTRSTNLMTGDFSTMPRDATFYIENGKIKYPIKNIRISDNMLNILRNITNIANNSEQVKGWEVEKPVTTPSILVKGLNITRPLEL